MTIQDVIDFVSRGEWYLDESGCLSSVENDDCPLWFAYRHIDPDDDGDAVDYMDAGERMGLPPKAASVIAAAADNRGYPEIRRRLLVAAELVD